MTPSAREIEKETLPRQADKAPWYSVDLDEPNGPGSWGCRARSASEAMQKAERAHRGTGCTPVYAEFDKFHLQNRIPKSETRIYTGVPLVSCETRVDVRGSTSCVVNELDPRLDLANHSPTGFSWGYEGSGPAQLSLALLADALEDDERALKLYQPFKTAYIAKIPIKKEWWLSSSGIYMLANITEHQMEVGRAA